MDFNIDDLVDFTDTVPKTVEKCYMKDGKKILYDSTTVDYYVTMRKRKIDPITSYELDPDYAFEFPYEWDPYTGERKDRDPFGSLWFDPNALIYNFYVSRLRLLWKDAADETTGFYQGYYDSGLGAGDDLFIASRGTYPELYTFRLPIIDCYLTNDHSRAIPTMGPKLTDEEIKQIEILANKTSNDTYKKLYKRNRPSVTKMKYLYDQALDKTPDISMFVDIETASKLSETKLNEFRSKANMYAVEQLKVL